MGFGIDLRPMPARAVFREKGTPKPLTSYSYCLLFNF